MCNLATTRSKEETSFSCSPGWRTLRKDYKLLTADKSQVCDGRNWELFRRADKSDIISRYRPVRSLRSRSSGLPKRLSDRTSSEDDKSFIPSSFSAEYTEALTLEKHERSHSFQIGSRESDIPVEEKVSRRKSTGYNDCLGTTESGSRVTLRKLSEPMHRCSITNQTISSIMRPARYSSNNLAAMAKIGVGGGGESTSEQTEPTDGCGGVGFSCSISFGDGVKSQVDALHRCDSVPVLAGNTEETAKEKSWVASGVDFSQSMEVYVFKN